MRRGGALFAAIIACAAACAPGTASAEFGLKDLDVTFTDAGGGAEVDAGTHPFAFTTSFAVNTIEKEGVVLPDSSPRDLTITLPPGLAGNPSATVRCTTLEFLTEECPFSSQVGYTDIIYSDIETTQRIPFYNLTAPPGAAAKFGFIVDGQVPVTLEAGVNPVPPYNILVSLRNIPQAVPFFASTTTVWGFPADPEHEADRQGCAPGCSAGLLQKPFLTLPRACEGSLETIFSTRSWQDPATEVTPPPVLTHDDSEPPQPLGFQECGRLGFAPDIDVQPSSQAASAPSGIDVELRVDDEGLNDPTGTAQSDIKKVVLTLPEGMTANPSLAEGLATCSSAQYERETLAGGPGDGCPEASKIGTVEVETPLLEEELLRGQVFVAAQGDNPFDSLIALYMVIRDHDLGILVKAAGRVEPDPRTGQLTTTFGEPGHELPQFPLSRVAVHLREGGRSPLITPSLCGEYEAEVEFTPWANPGNPLPSTASFEVTRGVGGSPSCPPGGTPPFEPGFEAGSLNNAAGQYSPFLMRLTRRDGDQDLTRFDAVLPPGVTAKLAGVGRCSDAQIALARTKSGKEEQASPSCPANSRIGGVTGGAGVGAQLTYVPGDIYLAGPYAGAPLSVVAIVPAVAGPFDVGNVVVREALRVDPRTAKVHVDGASSDPLPHILAGIPLTVRDVRVRVDRPNFALNPTSCDPFATQAQIWGGGSNPFSLLDDSPVGRSARFQAADCAALGFSPRLSLRLKGGVRRGAFPALRAVYRTRPGDANLSGLALRFPRSAFIEQGHFRTICTRVQYARNACPSESVYGRVEAFTPLLDEPLRGPVYLRSSDNDLPDAVFALKGIVDVEAVVRIDSARGGLRATVIEAPDVPVSRVAVAMHGGQKGLFVNSRNLCASTNRAEARFTAHSNARRTLRPVVRPEACRKAKKRARRSAHRR